MAKRIDRAPLYGLGLSDREADVYLELLKRGPSRAGVLIRAIGAPNSVMHLTLGRLVARGFASYILKGQIKTYVAIDPTRLLEMADEQRRNLAELVPKLCSLRETAPAPQAEVYEGITGLKNMCYALIQDAEPGDEYLFLGFSSPKKELQDEVYTFYREFTEVRMQRGLVLRGVANESMREIFRSYRWPHKNIRFVSFPILQNISICGDRAIIVPWSETRTSFLITSRGYTDNLRAYFNAIWSAA